MKIYGRADVQEVTIPQPCYRCREYEGRALPKPGCRDCEIEPAHVHKKKAKQHRIEVDCAECEQHHLDVVERHLHTRAGSCPHPWECTLPRYRRASPL